MKLIKFILKIVLFIVLLLVIAVVIVLWIGSDSSETTFTPSEEEISVEKVIGEGVYDSLNRIDAIDNASRNTSEDNYISVGVTPEQLNNIVVSVVRSNSNLNPNYLKDEENNYIVKNSGLTLRNITFEEDDGKLAATARITALGFYKTAIKISGTPSMDGKVLKIAFETFRLGQKIKVKESTVKDLFNKFNLSFDSSTYFDINTLTLSFDISAQIENITSSSKFLAFFTDCDYSVNYTSGEDAKLSLNVDTKNIFTEIPTLPEATIFTLTEAMISDLTDPKVTVSEANFNYMIQSNMDDVMDTFHESMTIGEKEFSFTLTKMYYNIDTNQVLAVILINELDSYLVANITLTPEKDSTNTYVENLRLAISSIMIGNTTIDLEGFVEDIVIPASNLSPDIDHLKIEEISFDKENETCTIDYAYSL